MRKILSEIAQEAGELILALPRSELNVSEKGSLDLLTVADQRAQALIVERLNKHFPSIAILGEEDADHQVPTGNFFTVDPIDGTAQFVHGGDQWAVMICYVERGVPTTTVIYQPVRKVLLEANLTEGAFLNGEKKVFGQKRSLARSIVGCEPGPWLGDGGVRQWIEPLYQHCLGLRSVLTSGGSAIELFEGKISAYLNPKGAKIWDLAPVACAVLAAGGVALRPDTGQQMTFTEISLGGLFAINQELLMEIFSQLRQ